MRKIFISYRRDDADEAAGRLSDHLVSQFGQENVFMDVDGIAPGRDFRKVIEDTLTKCDVLLGVMGRHWLDVADESGKRRLDNESDFVRLEIASALRRDIPVIPVRVQGASVPKPDQLPPDLQDFSYRNAVELTHERWNSDVQVLTEKLRRMFQEQDGGKVSSGGGSTVSGNSPIGPGTMGKGSGPVIASAGDDRFPDKADTGVTAAPKKFAVRRVVKWFLVSIFLLAMLGALGMPESDSKNTMVGAYFLFAIFFAWDPFKLFVVKS